MMSRKIYTAVAAEFKALDLTDDQHYEVAAAFARVAAADNSRFDRFRFMEAACPDPEPATGVSALTGEACG